MTSPQVGDAVGKPKQAIHKLRIGQVDMDKKWAVRLAGPLGTTPEYLLGLPGAARHAKHRSADSTPPPCQCAEATTPPRAATPADRMRAVMDFQRRTPKSLSEEMHIPQEEVESQLSQPGPPDPAFLALFCELTEVKRGWVMRGDLQGVPAVLAAAIGLLRPDLSPGLKDTLEQLQARETAAAVAGKT